MVSEDKHSLPRAPLADADKIQPAAQPPGDPPFKEMVWIPGGSALVGSNDHYPEEAPAHLVHVDGFWMDKTPVTNLQFLRFVKATGYVTLAERISNAADYPGAKLEMLVAGSAVFRQPQQRVDLNNHFNWWVWTPGADWRHPEGPGSTLQGRDRHPVVHVAWDDVAAYAAWTGKTLPSEAEWEYAARGGLHAKEYAWGDELAPKGKHLANTWQGEFPMQNLKLDGFERTSPVGSFPANGYGLYDMIGNVWEWTSDWYGIYDQQAASCCIPHNPLGAAREGSYDPLLPDVRIPRKVSKGGSFLCAPNYCRRYRPAARMAQPIDTATSNVGFRCIVRP